MRRAVAACAAAVLLLAACERNGAPGEDNGTLAPGKIEPTTGPYVSVAVDNHFHDVHPEDDITIDAARRFVIENEGRNLHNVTFPGAGIDRDIRPGRSFAIDPGDDLGPGRHRFYCRYHADQGMVGEIVIR